MTQQNDQWPRYGAPRDYDHRFEDHPFEKRFPWTPCLIASALLILVAALVWV